MTYGKEILAYARMTRKDAGMTRKDARMTKEIAGMTLRVKECFRDMGAPLKGFASF